MDFELKDFEDKINDITEQFMSLLDSNNVVEDSITAKFDSISNDFGGATLGTDFSDGTIPAHAIKFDDADDLNKRLEELYSARKFDSISTTKEPTMAFADYGIGGFDTTVAAFDGGTNFATIGGITNDKVYSTNEKEGNTMTNYGYNVNDESSIFSFATIPQERALAPKRSFTDVLFMDIPWDTKIDIWGGIKSFVNAQVKFTF